MSRAALDTWLWSLRPSSVTYRCEATKLFFLASSGALISGVTLRASEGMQRDRGIYRPGRPGANETGMVLRQKVCAGMVHGLVMATQPRRQSGQLSSWANGKVRPKWLRHCKRQLLCWKSSMVAFQVTVHLTLEGLVAKCQWCKQHGKGTGSLAKCRIPLPAGKMPVRMLWVKT